MLSDMQMMFSNMIGTLAVILLMAAFIGSSGFISRLINAEEKWKYITFAGFLGGAFGIYGNISGFDFNGI